MTKKPTAELISWLRDVADLFSDAKTDTGYNLSQIADRLAELEDLEKPEWFFRWASRAIASGDFKGAVETIFYHPANPYQKENPWAKNINTITVDEMPTQGHPQQALQHKETDNE